MVDTKDWVIQCDNCRKEYDIPEDINSKFEDMEGRKQLVLDTFPKCPYCNTQNSRIPKKRS